MPLALSVLSKTGFKEPRAFSTKLRSSLSEEGGLGCQQQASVYVSVRMSLCIFTKKTLARWEAARIKLGDQVADLGPSIFTLLRFGKATGICVRVFLRHLPLRL